MLVLLAQSTQPASINVNIDAAVAVILHVIEVAGIIGTAVIALVANLQSRANAARINAQHDLIAGQQTALNNVQLAMPSMPIPVAAIAAPPATISPALPLSSLTRTPTPLSDATRAALERITHPEIHKGGENARPQGARPPPPPPPPDPKQLRQS